MPHSMSRNKRKKSIEYSDPGKILDLVMSLTDDSCNQIQTKINTYLRAECEADLVLQVIVHSERMEGFIEVVGDVTLPRKMKINLSQNLQETLKSLAEQTDLLSSFDSDFQSIVTPYVPKDTPKKRLIMMSIIDNPFSVIFCVVASRLIEGQVALLVHECSLFVWPTLKKTIALEYECTLKQKCQLLLRVARRLFTQVASLETLLQIAVDQAKNLMKAEHCSVMLVDVDKMELVAYPVNEGATERRFPMNIGIAGEVIKTGTLINTRTPKAHPAFNANIDSLPNVDCKSLLCFPIREQSGIIGVGRVINKHIDPYFDAMDEEMALAFSIYCGVCIIHSMVYKKIEEAHIRNALSNELVMYHMKVTDSEVSRILECTGYHKHPHLSSLHFNPRVLPLRELPCYVMRMFAELGYDKMFNIKPQKLARFILYVKKGYRDVPYHSWLHGFNVAQWAFAAIQNYKLVSQGYYSDLQAFMFVVAGLIHDIDHRGTTNSFHMNGQTTLAALYSSEGSVMERHHLAQGMCILNTEGCDIMESLPRRDYDRAIMLLRDYVLATDLANYFKSLEEYKVIAVDFQRGNRLHTTALQCLLMNAADLSDQLKDWGNVKKTAAAVLTEFFAQGKLEKIRGEMPAIMMDQEKCFIPDLEIQFLKATCLPLYGLIATIIPRAAPCIQIIESHIERWVASKPVFSEVPVTAGLSVLLSPELDNLIDLEMEKMEKERLEQLEKERLEAEAEAEESSQKEES